MTNKKKREKQKDKYILIINNWTPPSLKNYLRCLEIFTFPVSSALLFSKQLLIELKSLKHTTQLQQSHKGHIIHEETCFCIRKNSTFETHRKFLSKQPVDAQQFSNILHSYTKISTTKSTFLQENEWSHLFETYSLQNIHLRQMKSWKTFFNILKKVSLILTQKFFKKDFFFLHS